MKIFINGYLSALSDMSGQNSMFFSTSFLMKKCSTSTLLKTLASKMNMHTMSCIEETTFKNYDTAIFLDQLIDLMPYGELYDPDQYTDEEINKIEKRYKQKIISRLSDDIDNVFNELNVTSTENEEKLLLVKKDRGYCIVFTESREDIILVFYFYLGHDNESGVYLNISVQDEYNSMIEKIHQEHTYNKNNIPKYDNGLTHEVNQKLVLIMSKIQSQGFVDNPSEKIFIKYFSIEKLNELKEIYNI